MPGLEALRNSHFQRYSIMKFEDQIPDIEEKLEKLIELRQQAEKEYGELLTLLDEKCGFPLPQEQSPQIGEIKDSLNRAWDVSSGHSAKMDEEDRLFWRDVARNVKQYVQPMVERQREFNSLTVHLLNEFTSSVLVALERIRDFQNKLILYFQKVIPVIDTKNREVIGIEDKNLAVNLLIYREDLLKYREDLLKFQESIVVRTKQHADLLFQELSKRMETLQIDSRENGSTIQSLQTSVRSLHHLANAWKSAKSDGAAPRVDNEYRYYHFEEDFRGSREFIREKFAGYVSYYRDHADAPVLDLGCGRGEFLELLKQASIPGIGVDSNRNMVQKCKEMGLAVSEGDLLEFLKQQGENSLGGIFCSQVVEHLPAEYLLKLIEAAHARLKDGAPILLETVNIASAFGFLQVYTKDLTHRTPIHPDTLRFLVAAAGFQNPQVLYQSPVPAVAQLKLLDAVEDPVARAFNENMTKLNRLLYDHQEYAVLAHK